MKHCLTPFPSVSLPPPPFLRNGQKIMKSLVNFDSKQFKNDSLSLSLSYGANFYLLLVMVSDYYYDHSRQHFLTYYAHGLPTWVAVGTTITVAY